MTVNGEGITLAEFDSEVARYTAAQTALGKTVASMDATKAVIDDMTSQVLLSQGARAAGFVLSDSALQARIDALAVGFAPTDFRIALAGVDAATFEGSVAAAVADPAVGQSR